MILDKEKYKNYHCNQWRSEETPKDEITTLSLGELYHQLCNAIQNANQNNQDVFKVPVFIRTENHSNSRYCIEGISEEFGRLGMSCEIITETNGKYSQHFVLCSTR